MIIPLPLVTGLFEGRTLFTVIASLASAVAIWAQTHQARQPPDPVEELTERLRHPWKWAAKHPVRAVTRRLKF